MVTEILNKLLEISQTETLILTAIAVFFGSIIAGRLVEWFLDNVIHKLAAKTTTKIDDMICEIIHTPITLMAYVFGAWAGFYTLGMTPQNLGAFYPIYKSILIVIAAYIIISTSERFWDLYERYISDKTPTKIDDLLMPFARKLVPILSVAIAFLLILRAFNCDITPFLAGAGILGIVIGMAAQDTLSNFFSGLLILFESPFKVRDRIEIGKEYIGDVVEIGNFATKIRTFENNILIIPNNMITKRELINHRQKDTKYKLFVNIGVAYGTNHKKVKKILKKIALETEDVLKDPEPSVFFKEFADSSLNFLLIVTISSSRLRLTVLDEINSAIQDAFKKAKIEIPFPQRDVHLYKGK